MATKYNLTVKVSTKGAVQVMGMGRFPVTLYADQWSAILERKDALLKFMADNVAKLAKKEDSAPKEGTARL